MSFTASLNILTDKTLDDCDNAVVAINDANSIYNLYYNVNELKKELTSIELQHIKELVKKYI